MDGLSRWDLVLWVVVAYGVLMALVRLWLRRRTMLVRLLHPRLTATPQGNVISAAADDHSDAA